MSTFTGLNTMVRGVYINQMQLNTVGHNITNADTEGYSRQTVNPAATKAEYRDGLAIGTGVDAMSITRARDVYADVQFRSETAKEGYYDMCAKNFDKIEAIFNDTNQSGIEDALQQFYKAWVNLSSNASDSAARTAVIEKGKAYADTLETAGVQLRDQIKDIYDQMEIHVSDINQIMEDIVNINRTIIARESGGAYANDLRDQRDLLADRLSEYINIGVHENQFGAYEIHCGGITLISGVDRLHLDYAKGVNSSEYGVDYGVIDYSVSIRESQVNFLPETGKLRAEFDAIEQCRHYIEDVANMGAFMMTTFNDQHKQGYDLVGNTRAATDDHGNTKYDSDGKPIAVPDTKNFFGETGVEYIYNYDEVNKYTYLTIRESTGVLRKDDRGEILKLSGVKILGALATNADFEETGGYKYVAAATAYDRSENYTSVMTDEDVQDHLIDFAGRTADGTNAVYMSELFNMSYDNIVSAGRSNVLPITKYADVQKTVNSLGGLGLNAYYKSEMTKLSVASRAMDTNISEQALIMDQIQNWRDATNGVDWNEELADMIKYQKGFGACSRCLSAMDDCLDRLVNNTGVVGR
mgnify:CR=1 FL=1